MDIDMNTSKLQDQPEGLDYGSPELTGVKATIIDFGLSRLRDEGGNTTFTPIPDEVMDGVGKQWDVYREMRGGGGERAVDWETYRPITNLMVSEKSSTYLQPFTQPVMRYHRRKADSFQN